jgi:hypothetical protein
LVKLKSSLRKFYSRHHDLDDFFFWPLRCLFFFGIRIVITPLISSNSSWFKLQELVLESVCNQQSWSKIINQLKKLWSHFVLSIFDICYLMKCGVFRIRISKKNRENNGQKKKYKRTKDKRTNNDLQNIHIKLKIE